VPRLLLYGIEEKKKGISNVRTLEEENDELIAQVERNIKPYLY
jgi:hypothetical protein